MCREPHSLQTFSQLAGPCATSSLAVHGHVFARQDKRLHLFQPAWLIRGLIYRSDFI